MANADSRSPKKSREVEAGWVGGLGAVVGGWGGSRDMFARKGSLAKGSLASKVEGAGGGTAS